MVDGGNNATPVITQLGTKLLLLMAETRTAAPLSSDIVTSTTSRRARLWNLGRRIVPGCTNASQTARPMLCSSNDEFGPLTQTLEHSAARRSDRCEIVNAFKPSILKAVVRATTGRWNLFFLIIQAISLGSGSDVHMRSRTSSGIPATIFHARLTGASKYGEALK